MIPDSLCNRVYFSRLLPKVCPSVYNSLIEVLSRYGVPYSLLEGTNDIWCRDYMPVQTEKDSFVSFRYYPDYLLDTKEHLASISDGYKVSLLSGVNTTSSTSHIRSSDIIIDGGNAVHSEDKIIMTSKIFEENPSIPPCDLLCSLKESLGAEIILLPWDDVEIYGHTDGLVRVIDNDTVLLTNYSQFDKKMAGRFRKCLEPWFKNIEELHFDTPKVHKYSWAYVNWLQTDKVLVIPSFGIPEDKIAFEQISRLMPHYAGRIEMVDARPLIRYEGCFNCASWTVYV